MASCSSCTSEIVPGTRWCAICRTNILVPSVGRLASPAKRLGAFVVDLMVPLVALGLGFSVVGLTRGALVGFGLFAAYIVWALLLFAHGMTPGKRLLGMRVLRDDGRHAGFMTMLIREWVGKWISGLILSLGFLWILFDRDRQGWHDKLMSTYVVG